jgi:hypothetical protein
MMHQSIEEHLDMKFEMQRVLAQAVNDMRGLGATTTDIARTLQFAVNVMTGKES